MNDLITSEDYIRSESDDLMNKIVNIIKEFKDKAEAEKIQFVVFHAIMLNVAANLCGTALDSVSSAQIANAYDRLGDDGLRSLLVEHRANFGNIILMQTEVNTAVEQVLEQKFNLHLLILLN